MVGTVTAPGRRLVRWVLTPMPPGRVAVLRVLVYAFVVLDVLVLHTSGFAHGWAAPDFYQPLLIGRVLHLPVPTPLVVETCRLGCVVAALLACTGRAPRMLGWAVFAFWTEYQVIAFSYGKVDHDRFGFWLALAVLPTVGRVRLRGSAALPATEAAGWALRCVQLAATATYFYAAWAKVRFGGWGWVNSATLARAVIRRGTPLSDWMLQVPWTLHAAQWGILGFELASPVVLFLTVRWQHRAVWFAYAFHAATWAAITIAFWPHLVTLTAFLPLERLAARYAGGVEAGGRAQAGVPPGSRWRLAATSR